MRKDLGVKPAVYPMPVLMIATYDENGVIDVMNAAWGMICGMDKISLNLTETHKTVQNIKASKAFTVSLADAKHVKEADFFGIASANTMADFKLLIPEYSHLLMKNIALTILLSMT